MSTILPLEVVFGKSTFSMKSGLGESNDNPLVIPINPFSPVLTLQNVTGNFSNIWIDDVYLSKRNYKGSFTPEVRYVPFEEGLGTLTPDWNAALSLIYDYSDSYRPSEHNDHLTLDVREDEYDFGAGGKIPEEVWRLEVMPTYLMIAPFTHNDSTGEIKNPMDDLGSPSWEDEFLTGECGAGGSERPEYGLLYPRKV